MSTELCYQFISKSRLDILICFCFRYVNCNVRYSHCQNMSNIYKGIYGSDTQLNVRWLGCRTHNLPDNIFTSFYTINASMAPDFSYHDLYNYLVNKVSHFTGQALKAYNSLEAYNYFMAGWVSGVGLWKIPNVGNHFS